MNRDENAEKMAMFRWKAEILNNIKEYNLK